VSGIRRARRVAPLCVAVVAALAPPEVGMAAPTEGSGDISTMHHLLPTTSAKFRRRARRGARWAGASRRQARKVVRRRKRRKAVAYKWHGRSNVASASGVTVKKATDVTTLAPASETGTGQAEKCGTATGVGWYGNAAGVETATMIMRQRWCWNGDRVTDWNEPFYSSSVNFFARAYGVEWVDGPIWRWNTYAKYDGKVHGRHSSIRRFRLKFCPLNQGLICFNEREPYIGLSKRNNGTYVDFYSRGSA
jgi:hypothetical protein